MEIFPKYLWSNIVQYLEFGEIWKFAVLSKETWNFVKQDEFWRLQFFLRTTLNPKIPLSPRGRSVKTWKLALKLWIPLFKKWTEHSFEPKAIVKAYLKIHLERKLNYSSLVPYLFIYQNNSCDRHCAICRSSILTTCTECEASNSNFCPFVQNNKCSPRHLFHLHCIERWIAYTKRETCPLDSSDWSHDLTTLGMDDKELENVCKKLKSK